jgi:uncharacterized protein (TIGR02284 family)
MATMTPEQERTINQLNHLIALNADAAAGFQSAGQNIKNSELETLFTGYARQHSAFQGELRQECIRLGGNFSDDGTLGGAVHRGWMDLKSALTGHSASAILASCVSGEESAERAYADAADANPTGQTHSLLEKHCQQIKGFRTHLVRLVGQTKDGVDFQKNE